MKRFFLTLLGCGAILAILFGGIVWYLRATSFPPPEAKLIANFNDHRAAFEKLKDMLIADKDLRRVAPWGVDTSKGIHSMPGGDFPQARYNQYLDLLRQVGGMVAHRDEGTPPEYIGICVWGWGFAGDTKHVDIRWEAQTPANQIANLDDHIESRRRGDRTRYVFRHIDQNWYLWTDW